MTATALNKAFSRLSLSTAELETARRENYAAGNDAALHASLTEAQRILAEAQGKIWDLIKAAQ